MTNRPLNAPCPPAAIPGLQRAWTPITANNALRTCYFP